MENFVISSNSVNIAIITSSPQPKAHIKNGISKGNIVAGLSKITVGYGYLNLKNTFEFVQKNIPVDVLIFFTTSPVLSSDVSSSKLKSSRDVQVSIIGIGNDVNKNELVIVTGSPNDVYIIDQSSLLADVFIVIDQSIKLFHGNVLSCVPTSRRVCRSENVQIIILAIHKVYMLLKIFVCVCSLMLVQSDCT